MLGVLLKHPNPPFWMCLLVPHLQGTSLSPSSPLPTSVPHLTFLSSRSPSVACTVSSVCCAAPARGRPNGGLRCPPARCRQIRPWSEGRSGSPSAELPPASDLCLTPGLSLPCPSLALGATTATDLCAGLAHVQGVVRVTMSAKLTGLFHFMCVSE